MLQQTNKQTNNSLYTHSVFVYSARFKKKTTNMYPKSINRLVLVMKGQYVYCEAANEFLSVM